MRAEPRSREIADVCVHKEVPGTTQHQLHRYWYMSRYRYHKTWSLREIYVGIFFSYKTDFSTKVRGRLIGMVSWDYGENGLLVYIYVIP